MSRRVYEGTMNVYFATDVADVSAPTVTEITAAVDITCDLSKDGIAPNISTNNVDIAALCETFDATIPGSFGADFQLTGFRDDTTEALWDLAIYGTAGFLIIEYFGEPGVLPEAGDKVGVWPVTMNQKSPANSAANTAQMFTVPFNVTAQPDLDAVVAA